MRNTVLFVSVFLSHAALAFGQNDKQAIVVQSNSQVVQGQVLHLKGAVKLTFGRQFIHADEVVFNVSTGDIEARGKVWILGNRFGGGTFGNVQPASATVCAKFVGPNGFEKCSE